MYKPFGLLAGVLGGILAGVIFKQVWKLVAGHEDAPEATKEDSTWREVLTAAAIHGAVFAVVKAVVDRAGATGVRRVTGTWPAKPAKGRKK
ncbi:TRAP-type C4-dicarboxylate transport system permease large subunit [Spinactinospora alkalitolerans]|uniref:TRAP-type C4-dicarboxylate transport system permease large subunit n=1 Tax=Spinactinospora alkalitolerans TaxID=687207 RepID=A0A852U3Y0_9ACTN|nr:DUF4235 domain-containing protein [Spinactinospora alkalitolerans]NYE50899.1 TRAP-type C4-dicarboxylate transport system permease large subunit [Spinactinospora alkalitolerans]